MAWALAPLRKQHLGPLLSSFALVCLVAAYPRGGLAAESLQKAEVHYRRGAERYKAGRFSAAHEEFLLAYRLSALPDLLFNMAQADEQLGHLREATEHLEAYLRDPNARDKDQVGKHLVSLRQQIASLEGNPTGKTSVEKPQDSRPQEARATESGTTLLSVKKPAPSPLRIAKWTTLSLGLVGVAAGAGLLGADGTQNCGDSPRQCMYILDTGNAGIAFLSVGLAVVGTSALLFALDYRKRKRFSFLTLPVVSLPRSP